LKIFKGPTPVAEVEKNNTVEPMICSQDAVEKRPETDFHFFSDSEITKYVIFVVQFLLKNNI